MTDFLLNSKYKMSFLLGDCLCLIGALTHTQRSWMLSLQVNILVVVENRRGGGGVLFAIRFWF